MNLALVQPKLGLGTYPLQGEILEQTILTALELGYRHIDTARFYDNEIAVGQALASSNIPRDEIFLTTKVWHDSLEPDALAASIEQSLQFLGVDRVDLLLIHWPSPGEAVPMEVYLRALRDVQQEGKARYIGVSNFTMTQLDRAVTILGPGALLANQIEVHPFLQNKRLVKHCHDLGIEVSAALPLARGKVLQDPTLQGIALAHGITPAQVALAWLSERGIVACPSSTKAQNLADNLASVDIKLSPLEMHEISSLDRGERLVDSDFAPDWDT